MEKLQDFAAEIHIIVELPARGMTDAHRAMRALADEISGGRRNWFTDLRIAGGDFQEVNLHPEGTTPNLNSLLDPIATTVIWDGHTNSEGTTYDPEADYNENDPVVADVALDAIIDALNLSPLAFENNESIE